MSKTNGIRYKDGNGSIYSFKNGTWYKNERRLPDAAFISSQGAAIEEEMLRAGTLKPSEFLENDPFSDKGYLYSKKTDEQGRARLTHTEKLSKIISIVAKAPKD